MESTKFPGELKPIEFLLTVPNSLSEPSKRWRRAFGAIFCYRALLSLSPAFTRPNKTLAHPSPHTVINLDPEQCFTSVDVSTLVRIVKERDLDLLLESGGVPGIASSLGTDYEGGILGDGNNVATRKTTFGTNTYPKPPTRGLFGFVWEALIDPTIVILLACAVVSLGFGIKEDGIKDGWYDGGSILVAVFLVVAISSGNNYRQSRQFDKLASESNDIGVDVVRGGRRRKVSIFDVVVGDAVYLKIGDQVPADGLLLDGHSLQVDESSMTGESDPVEINPKRHPFLMSGTKVADGYGRMLVTAVGMNTSWGEMMSSVARDDVDEETPLQVRLNKLTPAFGKFGLTVAVVVLGVLLIRYFTGHTTDDDGKREFTLGSTKPNDVMSAVVRMVAAAVTIVVIAIPEGLPMAVTLTLAYSMKRMMADNAMVRRLSACETMGSATAICTDKTGTLTMNTMKVTEFWIGKDLGLPAFSIERSLLESIHQGVALNTTGSVYIDSTKGCEYEFSGSPTEKALLEWAVFKLKMDVNKVKRSNKLLRVEAFNSEKKRSGVVVRSEEDGAIYIHWKGAAEMVIAMCLSYYEATGETKEIDDETRMDLEQIVQNMAACSLRCIAFAQTRVENEEIGVKEDGLTLLGLVGLKDPCRVGVKQAVQDCQNAGVSVKMITGDSLFTAKAIATECGILEGDRELVIEGVEFRNWTESERMERVDEVRVMARSSPIDKLLMVQCLRKKGHVVAVTGDGTNDAPALKEADIGLSMGIQGTEVAKESSDIVILDDNFGTVATVLGWGRCVYNNIQKFIQFQLTVTFAALAINFIAAVSAGKVPLTTVQILWVNLIQDTLGALALATDKPTKDLMVRPPVGRTEPLITNVMWRNIVGQAGFQIVLLLTLQFKGEAIFKVGSKVNGTMMFNAFVLCQVFNEFNARKLEEANVFAGVHKNKLFLGIVGVTVALQAVMVEFLQRFADTERLSLRLWGACVGMAAVSLPIACLVKLIPVPEKPIFSFIKCSGKDVDSYA